MKKHKTPRVGNQFVESMKKVANEIGKLPVEITFAEYANSEEKTCLNDWELRKLGGFKALKNLYFPAEKHVIVDQASKLIRAHKNKVESFYGREIFLADEIKEVVREVLTKNPIKLHAPVKADKKAKKKKSTERTLVAHFSDLHYGTNIDANEMDNVNEFNWQIAARRTALMVEQIVTYKPQYRDVTDLVVCINGDILGGVIHNQEWFVDLLTTQFSGALSILSQGLSYLGTHFKRVKVYCTPGNHGRAFHKSSKDRASTHKWDSYENMLYVALREVLKSHGNIEVVIPESPYIIFEAQGHPFMQTHGDTVINVGNPGKSLDMKSIDNQINKINGSLIKGDRKLAAIIVGHVHVPTVQLTDSGCMLLINGCLIGVDPFAQSLGIFGNHPTQMLFEVTKKYPVGDMRMIQVKNGDNRPELEAIIAPFKGKL